MSRNHYSKYQRNEHERQRINTEWTISPHKGHAHSNALYLVIIKKDMEIQTQAGSTNYLLNHINDLGHVI